MTEREMREMVARQNAAKARGSIFEGNIEDVWPAGFGVIKNAISRMYSNNPRYRLSNPAKPVDASGTTTPSSDSGTGMTPWTPKPGIPITLTEGSKPSIPGMVTGAKPDLIGEAKKTYARMTGMPTGPAPTETLPEPPKIEVGPAAGVPGMSVPDKYVRYEAARNPNKVWTGADTERIYGTSSADLPSAEKDAQAAANAASRESTRITQDKILADLDARQARESIERAANQGVNYTAGPLSNQYAGGAASGYSTSTPVANQSAMEAAKVGEQVLRDQGLLKAEEMKYQGVAGEGIKSMADYHRALANEAVKKAAGLPANIDEAVKLATAPHIPGAEAAMMHSKLSSPSLLTHTPDPNGISGYIQTVNPEAFNNMMAPEIAKGTFKPMTVPEKRPPDAPPDAVPVGTKNGKIVWAGKDKKTYTN